MNTLEKQKLVKDIVFNGGSDMINFSELADFILSKGKNKNKIFKILTNDLFGKLNKEDENNKNLKELIKIIFSKLKNNNNFKVKKNNNNNELNNIKYRLRKIIMENQ